MEYNIKLFVHGVPNGQDIWGTPGADAKYIEAFYGRKSTVASQLILEIMQLGSETNAYYTYYYNNSKLQEKDGRTGGYFALTLRINYYYADIQNIYNLIEAAFNKYIIDTVLEPTIGGGYRFKISQFNQVNEHLCALEKELKHYLMHFSDNKDFISLGAYKSNGQTEIAQINLLEATPNVVANHVKSNGRISISPLYPSSKEQQQINAVLQKAQQDVIAAQKDKENGILAIKNEYKNADKTIALLRDQNEKANKEISRLKAIVSEQENNLRNTQSYKASYEQAQRELEKRNKLIAEIKKNLSGLSGISELLGVPGAKNFGGYQKRETKKESNGFASFIKAIHPFLDFIVMIILICIICFTLPKSCKDTQTDGWFSFFHDKKEVVDSLASEDTIGASQKVFETFTPPTSVYEVGHKQEVSIESLHQKYPNAKIDIKEVAEDENIYMSICSGKAYHIQILNGNNAIDLNGEWNYDGKDFNIYENNIMPCREGKHKISYTINGEVFLEKEYTVKP